MRVALLLCFVPAAVLAQPTTLAGVDPSRGATLPPVSAATVDDATALTINPAALSSIGALQLFYAHERSLAKDDVVDSLYLGDTFLGMLGTGVAVEWVRSPSRADFRRTGWGLSLGPKELSVGVTWNHFQSDESADLSRLTSFDIGLSLRPARRFSFGATIRNVDAPSRGAVSLPREFNLALGIRPFGERYTLGVDYVQPDGSGTRLARLGYSLQAELFQGLWLGAGVSHGFGSQTPLTFQLSATFNFSRFGIGYAVGGAPDGMTHTVLARASMDRRKPITLSAGKIALVDLNDQLSQSVSTTAALLGQRQEDPYLKLTRFFELASKDDSLKGVVLKIDSLPDFGLAKAQELRSQIIRLRASGKQVYALMLTGGDPEYVVASAADKVFSVPEATLQINGFSASVIFVGSAMNKLHVKWDVARVGAYKNAPDQLTREAISPEQLETINALLDTAVRNAEKNISEARRIPVEKYRQAQADGMLLPTRGKELGLIDQIVGPEELDEQVRTLMPGLQFDPEYSPTRERSTRWGLRRKVAVIPVIGGIAGGKSRQDPLGVQNIAGAETVVKALQAAMDDSNVAAIVLRVDSGGGDTLASDLMYRAVLQAKKKKPVVASMGDVAASGGYYVAMAADEVFASPTTITGSIGVFMMKPAFNEAAEKLGIHADIVQRGEMANLLSPWKSWDDKERAAAQKWVDAFYDGFITRVAEHRKLEKTAVDQLARGRVWSGEDAKARGLVDKFGGLSEAIASAKQRANISESEDVELDFGGDSAGLLSALGGEPGVQLQQPPLVLSPELREVITEVGISPTVLLTPGLKALMPFQLRLR